MTLFRTTLITCLFVGLFVSSSGSARELTNDEKVAGLAPTSLVRIIARPEEFDGKWLGTKGFLSTNFEDNTLYLTEEHARYLMNQEGIDVEFDMAKLDLSPSGVRSIDDAHHKHVFIYGQFQAKTRTLAKITRLVVLERPAY